MKKLCADQKRNMVTKLVALFNGLSPQDIDAAVTQAKEEVSVRMFEDRKISFGQLFDSQMLTLGDRGCPEVIIEMFHKKRDEVLSKAVAMEIPEEHTPFIPVIPRSYLGIYGLAPMIRNDGKVGFTYLNPNEITDEETPPKGPYFIYDIENGTNTLGRTSERAEQLIKEQGRLCHILDEDIALAIHTDVLLHHYLWSTGSRFKAADDVPTVCLYGDRPELHWGDRYISHGRWGSASSRSRA